MIIDTKIYGFEPNNLFTSADEVWERLDAILSDKLLRFNPYSVDDSTLLACAERGRWLPYPALTQMVVFHFHDIHKIYCNNLYTVINFHIGNNPEELQLSVKSLMRKLTYTATLQQLHTCVDGKPVTNEKIVERMQGKDYFVSHSLPGLNYNRHIQPAYRMFRLKGSDSQKADLIRVRMIEAKIRMLKEIISHPYTPQYLRCSRNFIDYVSPIQNAINLILQYPHLGTFS